MASDSVLRADPGEARLLQFADRADLARAPDVEDAALNCPTDDAADRMGAIER